MTDIERDWYQEYSNMRDEYIKMMKKNNENFHKANEYRSMYMKERKKKNRLKDMILDIKNWTLDIELIEENDILDF